jgi:WD40 repeat protein
MSVAVCAFVFVFAEAYVVTCSQDATVRVWDIVSGCELSCLRGHKSWVRCCEWSPRGDCIVSVYVLYRYRRPAWCQKVIRISRTLHPVPLLQYLLFTFTASRPFYVVYRGGDRRVGVWRVNYHVDTGTGTGTPVVNERVQLLQNHSHIVWQCCFSDDGSKVATVSEDGTAIVFDVGRSHATGSGIFETVEQPACVEIACFAPCSGMRAVCFMGPHALLCGGGDGTLFVVNLLPSR